MKSPCRCLFYMERQDLRASWLQSSTLNFWRTPSVTKPMLWDEEVLTSLSELHAKFVVFPIYKAANNIALICKWFYILELLAEVDIPGNTSSTLKLSEDDPNNIIQNNTSVKNLVYLSMINLRHFPKMHFSPPRARLMIASSTCSTKPFSKVTSSIFKHTFNQVCNFHYKSFF